MNRRLRPAISPEPRREAEERCMFKIIVLFEAILFDRASGRLRLRQRVGRPDTTANKQ